jgi:pyridoxal phosphate enzyme (YggS family)
MSIAENIKRITSELGENTRLVAVSKTKPDEDLMEAYNAGQRLFGENKVQELAGKYERLPKDIEWHFIGHLQTNKVKYIAPFVSLIHGVDSLKLLKTINKEAKKKDRVIDCLLQFHIATESTKFGLNREEAVAILDDEQYRSFENVRIAGVMGMATYTDDKGQVRNEFRSLKKIFDDLKAEYFADKQYFKEISMGMSGDYKIAIEEGSTLVRIGSSIFGARVYNK